MKVLHIINTLGSGGAERLVSELSIQYHKRGIETHVYVMRSSNRNFFHNSLEEKGVSFEFSDRKSLRDLRHAFDLIKILKNGEYNIIHAHLSFSLYYTALAYFFSWNKNYHFVYTEHSTSNRRRKKFFFKPFDFLIYKMCSKIICISKDSEDMLNKWLPSTKNKTITIDNGIDVNRFKYAKPINIRKEYKLGHKDQLLLSVGAFAEHKNQKILIQALSALGENYKLLLVGRGPMKDNLELLAKQLGVEEKVVFLGVRPDIEVLYKSVDLFVLASKREGFGLVAAEAMAAGLPVLVSDVPGVSKVVGEGGFTFKSDDLQNLIKTIKYIFNNDPEVQKRIKIASERVKLFSIDFMTDAYINVYKNIYEEQ